MTRPESPAGGVAFDPAALARELRDEEAYRREGKTARTLVREADLRLVLVVVADGHRVAEHHVDETASIHALAGHLRLHLPDRVVELPAGQLLVLARGLRHDIEAVGDSHFLLTLAWPKH